MVEITFKASKDDFSPFQTNLHLKGMFFLKAMTGHPELLSAIRYYPYCDR